MARVTVEDCIEQISNRFELVLLAAQRTRELGKGALPAVEKEDDKNSVIALREIADDEIPLDELRRKLVYGTGSQDDESAGDVDKLGLSADDPLERALASLDLNGDQHNEAWGVGAAEDGPSR